MQRAKPEPDRPNRAPTATDGTGPPTDEPPDTELPLDVVFDLLSNQRRRRILRYLLDDPETTLGTLAEHVASIENDKPERELSSSERKRVYIVLYQCHLPKLDDADVVEFDENRKSVTMGPEFDQLRPYLFPEEAEGAAGPAAGFYLGVSALGVGAFGVQAVLFPAAWLSGLILGAVLSFLGLGSLGRLHRSGRLAT